MSNNAHVAIGGEIGRAQAEQARAARVLPHVDHNPILLKPDTDLDSQVIVNGQIWKNLSARNYFSKENLLQLYENAVLPSLRRLQAISDVIVIEGAGSCAEVNLWDMDITNWRCAEAVNADVVIVGDIDKGGVFAQLIGTYNLLPQKYKSLVKGFVVNKFRGDPKLFTDGIKFIEKSTNVPVLGVVPMYRNIVISSEDALPQDSFVNPPVEAMLPTKVYLAVLLLPHCANMTDFEPFRVCADVVVHYLTIPRNLHGYQAVFIPGSKNVIDDMSWLKQTGWAEKFYDYSRIGGHIGGLCGGYQILSKHITDDSGKTRKEISGLGLLDATTHIGKDKTLLNRVSAYWKDFQAPVTGYEIHMGVTTPKSTPCTVLEPVVNDVGETVSDHGLQNGTGNIWGTYLHGLFDSEQFRTKFLERVKPPGLSLQQSNTNGSYEVWQDQQFDLLADHLTKSVNLSSLEL